MRCVNLQGTQILGLIKKLATFISELFDKA